MPTKPPKPGWQWDDRSHRYRDQATGRYINQKTADGLRDAFIDRQKQQTARLTDKLVDGKIGTPQWVLEMRAHIKTTYVTEYAAARGGMGNVSPAEWGKLGAVLKQQYGFLNGFAQDINAGKLAPGQITTRANLYIESSSQAYERGKALTAGAPTLPAYPGDGQTECRSNCRCSWRIEEQADTWDCTWELNEAEHCPGCVENAARWNPLVMPKGLT